MFLVVPAAGVFCCALFALAGNRLAPHDPLAISITNTLSRPGGAYPLGTDELGRCVLSRLLSGGRATLGAAFTVEAALLAIGICAGVAAGYYGGLCDTALVVVMDILLAFPSLILALVIAGLLGAGIQNVMLAMILVYWVEHARVARSMARSLREKEFVLAARALGSPDFKIIMLHIVPHLLPTMLVLGALNMSSLIIGISSLSFIGLGARPPAPEWGALLAEQRGYMRENPLAMITTILCVMCSAASFQFLGEAARDILNPRTSHVGRGRARRL